MTYHLNLKPSSLSLAATAIATSYPLATANLPTVRIFIPLKSSSNPLPFSAFFFISSLNIIL